MLARLVSDLKEELFIHAASAAQSSASAVASVAKAGSIVLCFQTHYCILSIISIITSEPPNNVVSCLYDPRKIVVICVHLGKN